MNPRFTPHKRPLIMQSRSLSVPRLKIRKAASQQCGLGEVPVTSSAANRLLRLTKPAKRGVIGRLLGIRAVVSALH
jgi:hypothetical protein